MQISKKTRNVFSASASKVPNISTWSVIRFPSAICTNLRKVGVTVQKIPSVLYKSRLSILNCKPNISRQVAVTCCKFGPKQVNLYTQRFQKSQCMLAISMATTSCSLQIKKKINKEMTIKSCNRGTNKYLQFGFLRHSHPCKQS